MNEENKLKSILENEGLTRAKLAREAGLSMRTISNVCSQRTVMPLTQYKILMALNRLSYAQYEINDVFIDIDNN